MLKSCSRCGRIHPYNHRCNKGRIYKKNDIDKLRSTSRWTNKSIEIREASNYLCSVCLDEGIYNYNNIEVHHITKLQDNHELLLENENLICLCKYHHKQADEGKLDKEYLINLVKLRDNMPNGGSTPLPTEEKN